MLTPMTLSRKSGFTLIELSIALAIIGLIVGGILVGRDLIHVAELRAIANQVEKYNTAVNTFRLKYNCLPGDCTEAVDLGLGDSGGPGDNGNGNGFVDEGYLPFWYHLSKAQLIEGNFDGVTYDVGKGYPGAKIGRNSGFLAQTAQINDASGSVQVFNALFLQVSGLYLPTCSNSYCEALSPLEAFSIDSKSDDGLPFSGRILSPGAIDDMAFSITMTPPYFDGMLHGAAGDTSVCVVDGAVPTYNTRVTNFFLCSLLFKAQF